MGQERADTGTYLNLSKRWAFRELFPSINPVHFNMFPNEGRLFLIAWQTSDYRKLVLQSV